MSEVIEAEVVESTDLEPVNTQGALTFTPEQIDLIRRTVLTPRDREATDDELHLLAHQAQRTGLDPLARQIYGIYRKQRGVERMTIQVSIDGLRLVAQRSGRYLGQTPTYWADDQGEWHDVWLADAAPAAAKVGVYMRGAPEPIWAVARMKSYRPSNSATWDNMPEVMIAKCAEALALRKAFPAELSGLYSDDEMEQADRPYVEMPYTLERLERAGAAMSAEEKQAVGTWIYDNSNTVDQERLRQAIDRIENGDSAGLLSHVSVALGVENR